MQRVHVQHHFSKPVEKVFGFLAEHENLSTLFPARVERVRDGDASRNGPGSVRQLSFGGLMPFQETTLQVIENELIEYRITKGSPLRGHRGVMRFATAADGGTDLDYEIQFGAVVPGLAALIKRVLTASIKRGLPKVDQLA